VTTFHGAPANQADKVEIDEVQIKVLTRELALVTARGRYGPELGRKYTITDLLQRTGEGWKIIHEHESLSDPDVQVTDR
jgi:ketosteroid isomerase-like protein